MFTIEQKDIENMQTKLKLVRQTLGLGVNDFAGIMGVTRQTVYNIENYKAPLTQTQYLAIRSIIDLSLNEQPEKRHLVEVIMETEYNSKKQTL